MFTISPTQRSCKNHRTNCNLKPSFLVGLYELGDRFGRYKSAGPSTYTSKGTPTTTNHGFLRGSN